MKKPKIGITTGDVNGIGLEIILNTLSDTRINNLCTPIIYGSLKTISIYRKIARLPEMKLRAITNINDINSKSINIIEAVDLMPRIVLGQQSTESALYSFESLKAACKDLKNNAINALVTAPVDKKSISEATNNTFLGQTEFLEKFSKEKNSLMFFISKNLKLALITNHVSIKDLPTKLSIKNIINKINILHESLKKDFWIQTPKIAVLGLNPHASDNGLIGTEEEAKIKPAIEELRNQMIIEGPFPADSFFARNIYKNFDATIAMYHDQGLVPFKMISEDLGVNFTAGLDFIRTSPTHGVAYNLAGKGMADINSFRQAIYTSIDIARARNEYLELSKNPLPFKQIDNLNNDSHEADVDEDTPNEQI